MSRNSGGTYTLPAGNPVVTGTVISSTTHNNTMSDVATALTQSIASTGVTTPTANLPMGTFRHTGVGNATAQACYSSVTDIQNGSLVSLASVAGTDTITANAPLTVAAYSAGQCFRFVAVGANTGAVTLNVSALGAKAVTKFGATALTAGDIASGAAIEVVYDGTRFQVIGGLQTFLGIAAGTVNFLTGASIASASTINLDTATGNRVHITGTTTITAVTLTRGPRTVIFDGALILAHNATTNNLPGAVNITTAAGDRATYESDGAIVYLIAYTKANGAPLINAGDHEVYLTSGNGYGSTNTMIRRFTTTLRSTGTAITYADSATLGASFTINETGIYSINYVDSRAAGDGSMHGISLNSTQLTTAIDAITAADRLALAWAIFSGGAAYLTPATMTAYLTAGAVVRAHTRGLESGSTAVTSYFQIRKIGV